MSCSVGRNSNDFFHGNLCLPVNKCKKLSKRETQIGIYEKWWLACISVEIPRGFITSQNLLTDDYFATTRTTFYDYFADGYFFPEPNDFEINHRRRARSRLESIERKTFAT